jgi:hypothetical protein
MIWLFLLFLFLLCGIGLFFLRIRESFANDSSDSDDSSSPPLEHDIDVVYYINLDHRTDRKNEFLREIEKLNFPKDKIKRISAVYMKDRGHLGCSKSHILAMEDFVANEHYRNCIVFEDDFMFTTSSHTIGKMLQKMKSIPYDVCMLSANEQDVQETSFPFLKKVNMALTTAGYMVNKPFAPRLLQNFREGAQLLEKSYLSQSANEKYRGEYAVDQYWIHLQPGSNWYLFSPKLGKQRPSFSDIMNGNVEYSV